MIDPVGARFLKRRKIALELLVSSEHLLARIVKKLPGRRQFKRPFLTNQKLTFMGSFEFCKLLRDGRLAYNVLFSRLGKRPHLDKITINSQNFYI